MRKLVVAILVLALGCVGAYLAFGGGACSQPSATSAKAAAAGACSAEGEATSVACESHDGKVAGHFDAVMSGACRFACATKLNYKSKDVQAQPGATAGRLTQCPVSGVVFAVDAKRPRVRIGRDEYVTCCDKCAQKLKRDPRHYLKA